MPKKTPPEGEAKVLELYKQGFTVKGIVTVTGISSGTVYNILRRCGVNKVPIGLRIAKKRGWNALDWHDDDILY